MKDERPVPSSIRAHATRTSMKGGVALVVLLGSLLGGAGSTSAQDLRLVPLDHWAYEVADALILRHPELSDEVWLANRPWRAADFIALVSAAGRPGVTADERSAAWLGMLRHEFGTEVGRRTSGTAWFHNRVSARYQGTFTSDDQTLEPGFRPPRFGDDAGAPTHRGIARHDFAAQFGSHLALGWRYVLDSNIRNDPTRRTRLGIRNEEAAFEVLDAYMGLQLGPTWPVVGRAALSLGPGRASSPFVSDSSPSIDQIRIEIGGSDMPQPLRFTGLVGQLSRERPNRMLDESGDTIEGSIPSEDEPVPGDVTRWLYLQRFDWKLRRDLQVAISEAALVTGVNRGVEFRFANPMLPFMTTQEEDDEVDSGDVNISIAVEGVYSGLGTSRLYGILYVQELFIDEDLRESIGNQLAWRLGGEWADPGGWRGATVGAEYTRVNVFTYLHRGLNTNWSTFGVPLGSMLGPDADQAVGWLDVWIRPRVRATLDVMRRRGGERSMDTLESAVGAGNPEFPSGVLQEEWRVGLEGRGFLPEYGLEGRFAVHRSAVEAIGHEPGAEGDFWRLFVALQYRHGFQ